MKLTPEQQTQPTRRAISPGMENHLHTAHPVLDHGFVRVVDYMGNDEAIAQAARVSYGTGTKTAQDDAGLIRYLMRHWHSTPFEMCEIKLHVKLPVFVARQWIRHRTANVNEYSARYSILDREFYFPEPEQIQAQSTTNAQGKSGAIDPQAAQDWLDLNQEKSGVTYGEYLEAMNDCGIARELARINLPANIYTQWYWKVDLHNLFHFLRLRADAHAQYEIRVYADLICKLVSDWVPEAHAAFEEYRLGGAQLSHSGLEAVQAMLRGETVTRHTAGMSAGEWREFQAVIDSKAQPI